MPGPGPNKYLLPTLTGFDNHDPRKVRGPAFSVGFPFYGMKPTSCGSPGPKYDPGQYVRTGSYRGPNAVVLPRRGTELKYNGIPASIKYNPGPDPSYANIPSAVVLPRRPPPRQSGSSPGPNKYLVKGTVGRPNDDLPTAPSWSILMRNIKLDVNRNSPGPKYGAVDLNYTKRKSPIATVSWRHEPIRDGIKPGPKYLGPYRALKSQEPSWTMGMKHSDQKAMLLTSADLQPFYGF
ncbi:Hypothetical protein NTJ_08560 [Nesidiocoris tenuis]|uniref:Outer dense fiber protein 3 n=1 Tax=Nesidiocoris tenuis TaxID=355587 RepID=A0ABN7AZ15_9HEMI|nr:Hypothetical protein NTJ_08560 [Nesidiocoris tenuis]